MKKINSFLSLLFLISLPLASCDDDKNDPIQDENGSGNGNSGIGEDYSFMVNNNPFYYGMKYDKKDDERNMGLIFDHQNSYSLQLTAFSEPLEYFVDYERNPEIRLDLGLTFRPFNLSSVKEGDKLILMHDINDLYDIDIFNNIIYEGNNYYLNYKSESDITIVSYKNEILTVNLNNLQFKIGPFPYPGSPDVLTLTGDIACEVDF